MLALNIGAGSDIQPRNEGWINLDMRLLPGIDVIANARYLPFPDRKFDFILANDILEHIPPYETLYTLREWRRVLKTGGLLRLRVPSVEKIARRLTSGALPADKAIWLFYGDQSVEAGGTEFGSHRTGFTRELLRSTLQAAIFIVRTIEEHETEHNLIAEAIV